MNGIVKKFSIAGSVMLIAKRHYHLPLTVITAAIKKKKKRRK